MLDAKGAVLDREGVRLSVVSPGFIDPKHYRMLPGATQNRSKQIWRLPLNVLGDTHNGASVPRHKTPESGLALRPYQCSTVEWIRETPLGCVVALGTGLGKQQPVDTRVTTPKGWRCIGDLQAGDFVFGSDGRPTRVLGVFPQGVKPSYRVTFSDHSFVEAGPEHLWTIRYAGPEGREFVVTTNQLQTRPKISWSNGRQTYTCDLSRKPLYLPLLDTPLQYPWRKLPIPPYTLGQLIANGGLAHGTPVLVTGTRDWDEIEANLRKEDAPITSVRQYGTATHATLSGLLPTLRALKLCVRSRDKFIPRVYLESGSAHTRLTLLRGLMDADGSCSKTRNRVVYHTTSPSLAEDVVELVEGLGGVASSRAYDRSAEDKPVEYQVRVKLPVHLCPAFTLRRKAERHVPGYKAHPRRTVQSVEYVRDVESICIAVDAPDQLYVTEHAILTHNTIVTLHYIVTDVAAQQGPFLICGPLSAAGVWVGAHGQSWKHYGLNVAQLQTRTPNEYWSKLVEHEKQTGTIHGLFINYEILGDWREVINERIRPACIVLDEAHNLRNVKIGARKAAEKVVRKNRVHKRIALTATPVVNDLIDLYSQLDLVQPGQFGTWVDFAKRYCNGVQNEFGWDCKGETHVEELQHRLGGALQRVDRFSVGAELPTFTRTRVNLLRERLTEEPMIEYDAVLAHDLEASLIGGSEPGAVLTALTQALKLISEAKRAAALEEIERLTGAHYKIAVFTWFKETALWVARALKKRGHLVFGPISGDTTKKKRLDTVQALEACPLDELKQMDKSAVFVGTLKTTGQAMDQLKCCGAGLVVDLWYVPMVMLQAEGRLHRIGRRGDVDWNYLVAADTVDDLIYAHLQRKAAAISRSLDDSAATSLCETLGGKDEAGDLKALLKALAEVPDEDEEG